MARIIGLALFLVLISSCSFKSLVIPNATYFIADHIGDKYDFYYNQEKEFKQGLDFVIKKNVDELKTMKSHLESIQIKEYELHKHLKIYTTFYYKVAKEINIIISKPFSEFNEDQIKHFWKTVENTNEIVLNRSKKDKTKEIAKRFEFFFGVLSEKQEQLIKKNINVFQRVNRTRLNNRLVSQKRIGHIFNLKKGEERQKKLLSLFNENLTKREPITNLMPVSKFCSQFFKTLSDKQVEKFKEKQNLVTEWIEGVIEHFSKN